MTSRLHLISGCSGGGKSSLLDALARKGIECIPEPGRRVVAEAEQSGSTALPWIDMVGFGQAALDLAIKDHCAAQAAIGPVVFDRGIPDAALALRHLGVTLPEPDPMREYRYARTVFMAPPWPEIYRTDPARRHGFSEAVAEYDRLCARLPENGYDLIELPKLSIAERCAFVLRRIAAA